MWMNVNYYEILEISRGASPEVVKAAYRQLAKKYHPDSGNNDASHEMMQILNEAYEILIDSDKRRAYDQLQNHHHNQTDTSSKTETKSETSTAPISTQTKSKFIGALRKFINDETDEQLKQIRSMWGESIEKRVSEGEAIADLRLIANDNKRATFRFERNLSKFRPGDELRLHHGDPFQKPYISCNLEAESEDTVTLTAGYNETFWGLENTRWVLDRQTIDVRFILHDVLSQLEADEITRQKYIDYVSGKIAVDIDAAEFQQARRQAHQIGMNSSQAEGFANALATHNYYLIQGPPGTGKTWVLAHLAVALARRGERVLITAFTHRAINNALRKIAEKTQYQNLFKVGQSYNADDLGSVRNYEYFEHTGLHPDSTGFIAGGTCFSVRGKRLGGIEFDTVIFDEAGQVTLPLAFSGMLAGKKHIFIGDHQQMPPVIVAEHEEEWVSKSAFELMYPRVTSTMLDTTYRMNQEINAFPSHTFYNDELKTDETNRHQRLKLNRYSKSIVGQLLNPEKPEVFAVIPHRGRGMRSPEEAALAAMLVKEALLSGVAPSEIAVVTPYRAQVRLIRQWLQKVQVGVSDVGEIVVDTVERIQGQERDLIIISLVTSDPAHATKRAEFYFMPNRLNVALTRPRFKRIILGSPLLFQAQPEDPKHIQWVELFRAFYQSSYRVQIKPEDLIQMVQ